MRLLDPTKGRARDMKSLGHVRGEGPPFAPQAALISIRLSFDFHREGWGALANVDGADDEDAASKEAQTKDGAGGDMVTIWLLSDI